MGPLVNTTAKPGLLARLTRTSARDRQGPSLLDHLHGAALDRYGHDPGDGAWTPYRPGSLRRLERELKGWLDARLAGPEDPTNRRA
ncbi:MAG: hypothetical protein AAF390_17755 [Pseudomonadota bacterium]